MVIFRSGTSVLPPAEDLLLFEILTASEERRVEEANVVEVVSGVQEYPPEVVTISSTQPDQERLRYKRLLRDPVIRKSSPARPEAADELASVLTRDFPGLKPFSDDEVRATFDRMRKRR